MPSPALISRTTASRNRWQFCNIACWYAAIVVWSNGRGTCSLLASIRAQYYGSAWAPRDPGRPFSQLCVKNTEFLHTSWRPLETLKSQYRSSLGVFPIDSAYKIGKNKAKYGTCSFLWNQFIILSFWWIFLGADGGRKASPWFPLTKRPDDQLGGRGQLWDGVGIP